MVQGFTPLRTRALDRLIDAGTWVGRDELAALTTCAPALDDALADLVIEGLAQHHPHNGYRLAAPATARRAAQIQRRSGKRLAVVGAAGAKAYHVGVAEERPDVGLVLYEMEIPNPPPGPQALQQHLAQVWAVMDMVKERGGECG